MATLYITEYADVMKTPTGVNIPVEPANAEQTVAIGGSTAQSSAFASNTRFVRLRADAICSVTFGTNPTATTTKARMAANTEAFHAVPLSASYKVAVITNT